MKASGVMAGGSSGGVGLEGGGGVMANSAGVITIWAGGVAKCSDKTHPSHMATMTRAVKAVIQDGMRHLDGVATMGEGSGAGKGVEGESGSGCWRCSFSVRAIRSA